MSVNYGDFFSLRRLKILLSGGGTTRLLGGRLWLLVGLLIRLLEGEVDANKK